MADAVNIATGHLPLGFLRGIDGHIHGNRMGVDNDFMVTCKDAAGTTQTACDKTTDSATVDIKWTGNIQVPGFSSSVDREGSWTITGLQSATATFNGSSTFSLDTTLTSIFRQGVTSSFMFSATAKYDAITVATADRQLTGGSASFEVKVDRAVTGTGNGSSSGSDNGTGAGSDNGTGAGSDTGTGSDNGTGAGSDKGSGAGSTNGSGASGTSTGSAGHGHDGDDDHGGGDKDSGGHDIDQSFDVHADITFNADHTATLVLDGSHTFTVDLTTGKVTATM
ncbi:MAG TPA: hypothetical protein VH165_01410 [Kofleriaceae bacterium]|nr:hypothetical protein [Kofleriaceae bacterium]